MNNKEFDAVILADGDYPTHPIPLSVLASSAPLVCCDGAAMKALENGLSPMAVVGDGDSLPRDMRERLGDKLHIVNEQDYNDLTKATRFAVAKMSKAISPAGGQGSILSIAYIGATGRREDHTLANIFLMPFFLEELGINPTIITDNGYFSVARGTETFSTFPRQQVSIFNISCSRISGSGLKWQTYAYNALWQGTLNEATGSAVTIDADGTYIIFRTFDRKISESEGCRDATCSGRKQ